VTNDAPYSRKIVINNRTTYGLLGATVYNEITAAIPLRNPQKGKTLLYSIATMAATPAHRTDKKHGPPRAVQGR